MCINCRPCWPAPVWFKRKAKAKDIVVDVSNNSNKFNSGNESKDRNKYNVGNKLNDVNTTIRYLEKQLRDVQQKIALLEAMEYTEDTKDDAEDAEDAKGAKDAKEVAEDAEDAEDAKDAGGAVIPWGCHCPRGSRHHQGHHRL